MFVNNEGTLGVKYGDNWQMSFQLLKIFNPLTGGFSLKLTLKKTSTLNGYKSRSGADIDLFFNYQFSIAFGPL